jgi:hypothetical protein
VNLNTFFALNDLVMKTLFKTGLLTFSMIVFFGCQKTEFIPVSSGEEVESSESSRVHQTGADLSGGEILTDKDKCKKCHPGRSMGIEWTAPYMSDNRYNSIEELIADFDFEKEVHGINSNTKNTSVVTDQQKLELINYLTEISK